MLAKCSGSLAPFLLRFANADDFLCGAQVNGYIFVKTDGSDLGWAFLKEMYRGST